jgi:hypothetical protein
VGTEVVSFDLPIPFDFPESLVNTDVVGRPEEAWLPDLPSERDLDLMLAKRNMTGVRRILDYFYSRSVDLRYDALQHLSNNCTKMALGRGAAWFQRPFVYFVAPKGQPRDPENYDAKRSTRHWFQTNLSEAISKYSPEHITKSELLELARMGDDRAKKRKQLNLAGEKLATLEEDELVNVCYALVCDMIDRGQEESLHELETESLIEARTLAAPVPEKPDYASAIRMLVSNSELRQALPPLASKTLEAFLRKLHTGLDADEAIAAVALDLKRDEQTVLRNLKKASHLVNTPLIVTLLADFVLPATPKDHASPTPRRRAADKADYQLPKQLSRILGNG